MSDDDVLVVGAGPTGLMLACELLRRGVRARVVDKLAARSPWSRAIAVHARTLEILEDAGMVDGFLACGQRLRRATFHAGGEQIVEASFSELDTRYPFALAVPQATTEDLLYVQQHRLGGRVDRGVELVGLTQDADGVTAELATPGGRETARAAYLVGCDGAHSAVRKLLGLAFDGDTLDERFLLADVKIAWDVPDDGITTFLSPDGVLACFPLPGGRWRIIASDDGEGEPALADAQAIVDGRADRPAALSDPAWLARFSVNTRQVTHYRERRVFLCGDAAHIHSPVGGQGMNTGMQDAHNLAWKLALVLSGGGREALLESYHEERHAIGANILRATELATRAGLLRHPLLQALRNRVARFLTSFEVVQQRIVRATAELDLSYRGSPIVLDAAPQAPGVHAGERVPPSPLVDGRAHTLLLFGELERMVAIADAVERRCGERLLVRVESDLAQAFGAGGESAYLIRPDLYVGFRDTPVSPAALLEYLDEIFT